MLVEVHRYWWVAPRRWGGEDALVKHANKYRAAGQCDAADACSMAHRHARAADGGSAAHCRRSSPGGF